MDFATELSGDAGNAIIIHVYPPGKTKKTVNPAGSRKVLTVKRGNGRTGRVRII